MLLNVDWLESRLLALGDKWNIVQATKTANVCPELTSYAAKFIVAYLQDLCRRRFLLGHWRELSDAHTENILRDMARFVIEQGGKCTPVRSALKMILPARKDGHASALGELIAQALRSGKIRMTDDGERGGNELVQSDDGKGCRLSYKLFMELAEGSAVDVPNNQLTAVLDGAEILVEEQPDGWVLNGDWLRQQIESAALPLQVVG